MFEEFCFNLKKTILEVVENLFYSNLDCTESKNLKLKEVEKSKKIVSCTSHPIHKT